MGYFIIGKKQLKEDPSWAKKIGAAMSAAYKSKVSRPAVRVQEAIRLGTSYLVSIMDQKVIGYVRIIVPSSKEKPVYVTEIAIRPEYRNTGTFRHLKRKTENFARDNGFSGLEFRYVLPKIARIFEREKAREHITKATGREIEITREEFFGEAGAKKVTVKFKSPASKRKPLKHRPL